MNHSNYTINELSGEQAFHILHTEWDTLWSESTDATHFQLWNWQYLYWKHVTPHATPYFTTLRDDQGRCRAIALMVRTRDSKTGLMTTGFVGEMRSDYNMFLAGRDVPVDAGCKLLQAVLQRHRYKSPALTFRHIPAGSWTAQVMEAYYSNEARKDLVEFTEGESYAVPLPATIDEYTASLGKRSRRDFSYDRRKLAKEHIVEFCIHDKLAQIETVIEQIETIDLARWGAESMYCRPRRRALERSIIKTLAEKGLLLVFLLVVDKKPVSFLWCSIIRNAVEVARLAYDPTISSKLSIGKVAIFYAIEECIHRGLSEFDLARGGEAYKGWLGARSKKIMSIHIHRSRFDFVAQQWSSKLGKVIRKQNWLRDLYRKYIGS